jgi:glutamine synthetase
MDAIVEYIWIDANGNVRSKARTLVGRTEIKSVEEIPTWNFDGSSTGQSNSSNDSEIILIPVSLYLDPFRDIDYNYRSYKRKCYLVLCECYNRFGVPLPSNTRSDAKKIFYNVQSHETWYGIEQEYVLYDGTTNNLLGWPEDADLEPEKQGKYYCGIGYDRTFGRAIVEEHYFKCLYAGINISGINEEVLPGQWEFQVGPCTGIDASDQLWMARYILHRVCEKHKVIASLDPKPVLGDWNGSGLHTNFSTNEMRSKNGIEKIYDAIYKLKNNHKELIKYCGDNTLRLTGNHETSKLDIFTFGVADRSASVRIPSQVNDVGNGYLEYRVPASNADPYLVTSQMAKIILLD